MAKFSRVLGLCLSVLAVSLNAGELRRGMLNNGLEYWVESVAEGSDDLACKLIIQAGADCEPLETPHLAQYVVECVMAEHPLIEDQIDVERWDATGCGYSIGGFGDVIMGAEADLQKTVFQLQWIENGPEKLQTAMYTMESWAKGVMCDDVDSVWSDMCKDGPSMMFGSLIDMGKEEGKWMSLFKDSWIASHMPHVGINPDAQPLREEMEAFVKSCYVPELTTLIITGDFDVDVVVAMITDTFGDRKNGEGVSRRSLAIKPLEENIWDLHRGSGDWSDAEINGVVIRDALPAFESDEEWMECLRALMIRGLASGYMEEMLAEALSLSEYNVDFDNGFFEISNGFGCGELEIDLEERSYGGAKEFLADLATLHKAWVKELPIMSQEEFDVRCAAILDDGAEDEEDADDCFGDELELGAIEAMWMIEIKRSAPVFAKIMLEADDAEMARIGKEVVADLAPEDIMSEVEFLMHQSHWYMEIVAPGSFTDEDMAELAEALNCG